MRTTLKRLGVVLLLLTLAGCTSDSEDSGTTSTAAEVTTTAAEVTTTAAEVTTTAAPVVDNSACIACHTSEETLQAFAVEEDAGGETLSEGEG